MYQPDWMGFVDNDVISRMLTCMVVKVLECCWISSAAGPSWHGPLIAVCFVQVLFHVGVFVTVDTHDKVVSEHQLQLAISVCVCLSGRTKRKTMRV
jgi:hypothetical protein